MSIQATYPAIFIKMTNYIHIVSTKSFIQKRLIKIY